MSYSFARNVLLSSVGFDRFIDALEEMGVSESVAVRSTDIENG